jgi:ABC-2 type transport system ATP-binding protein
VVEITDLTFSYGGQPLFSHLDLKLEAGNIYGLLGKNGAGKTTLLKLMCGLRFARKGQCRVFGFESRKRPAHMLEDVFMVAEELSVPPLRPRTYEALYAPFYPGFDHATFETYLKEFELDAAKKLTELSYGQRKKFILAFGLASGCRLLILDEPTNALDIPSKSQFRRLLAGACSDRRIIVVSTHQVRDLENLIDPIIILDEGKIIFQQPMQEVTRRLEARMETGEPSGKDVIYADKTLGGWIAVRPRAGGEETNIDLETLFNTVVANRARVAELFVAQSAEAKEARNG